MISSSCKDVTVFLLSVETTIIFGRGSLLVDTREEPFYIYSTEKGLLINYFTSHHLDDFTFIKESLFVKLLWHHATGLFSHG